MSEIDRQRKQIKEMRINQANRELQTPQVEFLDERQDTEVRVSTRKLAIYVVRY